MSVPPAIEQRLFELIPRLRRIRAVRGAARSVLLALLMLYAIALADIVYPLPGWARAISFAAWITTVGVLIWRWVLVPCRSEILLPEIAGELEKRLPEWGERLRWVVDTNRPNITPAVHALLVEDMTRRLKQVHFPQTISYIPAVTLAAAGLVALLSTAAVVACHPSAAHQLRRVALPWLRTYGLNAYYVHVVSPPPVVPRGEPVTIAAYPKRYNTNERTYVSHAEATLIIRDRATSAETQHVMQSGAGGEFHITLPGVSDDFDFCVQLGGVRSEWWPVVVVDAVELTEGTRMIVSPPPYVGHPTQTSGFANITAPQYSLIEFEWKFDRPVAFANLEWQPENAAVSENVRLTWEPDRCGALASLRVSHNGRLRLLVATEERGQKLFREKAVEVRVMADEPPRFEQLCGLVRRPRLAKPEDIVKIEFTATDDRGVTAAALEYQIGTGDNPINTLPLPLRSRGNGGVAGAIEFPLAGRVREGDVLRLRLRVFDNRTVEDLALVPQNAVYPPVGWSELRIHPHADSLAIQEVLGQRDDIQHQLASAAAELTAAASEIDLVQRESTGSASLEVHHQTRLQNARTHIQTARQALCEAAAEAQLTPELRKVATECREVAHELFQRCTVALLQAETDQPVIRDEALIQARTLLNPLLRRTRQLQETTATIAQHRFDRLQLLALASELAALATLSPEADRLQKHRQLAAQLDTIIASSPSLQQALETAKNAEFQQWLQRVHQRAELLQHRKQQAQELYTLTRQELIADIVRQQDELVQKASEVLCDIETACRLVGVTFPSPHELRRTAELAANGKTVEALAELEKHTQRLERIAQTFERWSAERRDPKEAAQQLARWQEDVLTRLRIATKNLAYIGLQEEEKARFQREQQAIVEAVRSLEGPKDTAFGPTREQAVWHSTAALRALADTGATAEAAMTAASAALRKLAASTPSVAERLTLSLRTVDSLRLQWEATSNTIELTLKKIDRPTPETLAKHWAPIADKQRQLLSAVEALDLPGLQPRHARIVRAMKSALADLHAGVPLDVLASQAWVRRELERLKWILEGHSSPDDRAEEAAQKLRHLAASLALSRHQEGSSPEPLAPVVQDVLRQLNSLVAPEAPALWQEARNLLQRAEQAIREGSPERIHMALEAAAEAARQLADRLNGRETDLERIQRLAYNRRSAVEKPKERLFSDETHRQLSREADELLQTRVGWAGGPLKKRALDLYSKLRAKSDLDRFGTDHKVLIAVLDELAAQMADNADLATLEPLPSARPPLAAERILPSSELAVSLRALIPHYRPLHTHVATLTDQLQTRLRPGLWPASRRNSLLQLLQMEKLTVELRQLRTVGEDLGALNWADAAAQQRLLDTIAQLREAEKRLHDARSRNLAGALPEAIQLWTDAAIRLLTVAERDAPSMPAVTLSVTGEYVLMALRAMRQPEESAIRRATTALEHAAQSLAR